MKRKLSRKNENDKQTADDLHHVACFELQAVLPTPTADISHFCHKSKHFTYSCTFCDRQMEALADVHCYLWHGLTAKKK